MYTHLDERMELEQIEADVCSTRDVEGALYLANMYKDQGDDESAGEMKRLARKWEQEDNSHDENHGN